MNNSTDSSILLGDFMVKKGYISRQELEVALTVQVQTSDERPLGEILVSMKLLDPVRLEECLVEHRKESQRFQEDIAGLQNLDAGDELTLSESASFQKFYPQIVMDIKKHYIKREYRTNLVLIDMQHYWLLALISFIKFLSSDVRNAVLNVEIDIILNEIISYTKNHFNVEELLIKSLGSDYNQHREEHKIQHRNFIKQVLIIQVDKDNEMDLMDATRIKYDLNKVYNLLNNWWLEHIAIHDQNYALILKKHPDKKRILVEWIDDVRRHKFLQVRKLHKQFYDEINNQQ